MDILHQFFFLFDCYELWENVYHILMDRTPNLGYKERKCKPDILHRMKINFSLINWPKLTAKNKNKLPTSASYKPVHVKILSDIKPVHGFKTAGDR